MPATRTRKVMTAATLGEQWVACCKKECARLMGVRRVGGC